VLITALATACTHSAPPSATAIRDARPARLWIGGDVFLGTGNHGALASIPAIVGGAPGIVNLEGPVGEADDAGLRADDVAGSAADRIGRSDGANSAADRIEPSDGRDTATDRPGASDDGTRRAPLRLLHSAAALAELRAAGVAIAGIANNHAADAGAAGPAATMRALRTIGVQPAGGTAGPATLMLGSLRVVITVHDLETGVPPTLRDELTAARRRGDALVATFHVTGPPTYLPRPELIEAVTIALDAGAAVVAAHGTHELARVERRGRAVIAWGLGNLAFACACTDEDSAALLDVALGPDGAGDAAIIPIDAGLVGGAARPAADPALTFELLEALGSTHLDRRGDRAAF
jgi:poly-gamma-glutamate synthesis protein (capsule biosynthesis protein)